MIATLLGFSTINIEVKNHDGYKNTDKPYVWLTQHDRHDDASSIIILPLDMWAVLNTEVQELRSYDE